MKVRVVNKSDNALPQYETALAAGMDLRAWLPNGPVELSSLERKVIPTGLYMEIPAGYEAQIRPRSGLSLKKGISLPNSPGTIDADYRGEIGVIVVNLSNEKQTIENGDRIAQMVINKIEQAELVEVEELQQTERAAGGFGSTGTK